ncbi:hypothetical protein GWK91_03760 [Virgibacillus sp. MSP4-1]|uniref:hypothetical protein n=1 Tax=Virgibacillus sp. MSP4-1 TaxID=2700081 RepID=UPI00039D3F1D|nr:hypothetical protein [Virgibacillus sp. MSP4-1]QHS22109.1 hypothetical protein GWK91_03760 [Virgibacillus sp. MSP4-1]
MYKWTFLQLLIILWSVYILTTYLSAKDHPVVNVLFFIWFFVIAFYGGKYFISNSKIRLLYIALAFGAVYGGYCLWHLFT